MRSLPWCPDKSPPRRANVRGHGPRSGNSMSNTKPKRRTSVERNIWKRADGRLEVGFRDSSGKQRWRVPDFPAAFDTITEARRARDAVLGKKASGGRVQPNPKLT